MILFLILVIPILIFGYFGLVPGLSNIMGASKVRNLGVTYTDQDYANYLAKTQTKMLDFADAPNNPDKPGKKVVFANPVSADNMKVSQQEITSAINKSGWLWMPIKNAQVRFSEGAVEISGNLNLDYITQFIGFIGGVGYQSSDIDTAVSWAKKFVNNAPIYIKANGSVTNNQLQLNVQEVQVGRFTAPADIAQTVLATGTQSAINNTPGLDAQSAVLKDGSIIFTGSHPTTIYVKTN
jgi:hypothetical protein